MNSKKLTGLADGSARTDSANIGNIVDGTGVYVGTVGGTADVITLTPSPAITAYAAGQTFRFLASGANTTNVTVQVSGLPAPKAVTKNGTTALVANDIASGAMVTITYDGTRFILTATSTATLTGTTLVTPVFSGSITGTYTLAGTPTVTGGVVTADPTTALGIASKQYVDGVVGASLQDFRLTLTTAVPVTTSDVTAAGTLYCTPYSGNHISLYDGSTWLIRTSAEFSLVLTLTSGKPYDVFCYDNAGTPTLETLVWTNDTTRATALAYQNGILVKSGAATRRYLGTLYASGANVTEDSLAKRYLWNYYHRVNRTMKVVDTTNTWTYNTAAFQQANASSANQLDFIIGVSEDAVQAQVVSAASNATVGVDLIVGIGLDNTTNAAQLTTYNQTQATNIIIGLSCYYNSVIAEGRHKLLWLERVTVAGGNTTFYGDAGTTYIQSGIMGTIRN